MLAQKLMLIDTGSGRKQLQGETQPVPTVMDTVVAVTSVIERDGAFAVAAPGHVPHACKQPKSSSRRKVGDWLPIVIKAKYPQGPCRKLTCRNWWS
jgi:hypothetical protein